MRSAKRAAVCVLVIGVVACGGKKPRAGGGAGAALPRSLEVAPRETGLVLGVNLAALRASAPWARVEPRLNEAAGAAPAAVQKHCGVALAGLADGVIVAGDAALDAKRIFVIVDTALGKAKANACIAALMTEENGTRTTTSDEGLVSTYRIENGDTGYAAWLDDRTALLTPSALVDRAWLDELLERRSSMRDNAVLMGLLAKVDPRHAVWGAVVVVADSPLAGAASLIGASPQGLWIDLELGRELHGVVGLRFGDAAAARGAGDKLGAQLVGARAAAGPILAGIKIEVSGADVLVRADYDERQLAELVAALEPMLR